MSAMNEERLKVLRRWAEGPSGDLASKVDWRTMLREAIAYVDQLRAERDKWRRASADLQTCYTTRWKPEIQTLQAKLTACEAERDDLQTACGNFMRRITASELARAKALEALRIIQENDHFGECGCCGWNEESEQACKDGLSAQPESSVADTLRETVRHLEGSTNKGSDTWDLAQRLRALMGEKAD